MSAPLKYLDDAIRSEYARYANTYFAGFTYELNSNTFESDAFPLLFMQLEEWFIKSDSNDSGIYRDVTLNFRYLVKAEFQGLDNRDYQNRIKDYDSAISAISPFITYLDGLDKIQVLNKDDVRMRFFDRGVVVEDVIGIQFTLNLRIYCNFS